MMKKNVLRQKLINREPINGTHISMPCAEHGELLGLCGFDYVWVDTEHAPIEPSMLLRCLNLIAMSGCSTIVRVPVNDYNATKKVIEMGPDGVVFPMINTKKLAQEAVESTLYPPYGTRGFGPMRAVRYGMDDVNAYVNEGSFDMARLLQVETEEAVRNLDEILTVPYVDGFIIGPCDLAASVGELGREDQPKTRELIQQTAEKLCAAGKSFGMSLGDPSEETVRWYLRMGANIISAGCDYDYMIKAALAMRAKIERVRASEQK